MVITDYFSKWALTIPLKEVKASDVVKFIKHYVIYHFGVLRQIVHDNSSQFIGQIFQKFCKNFRIQSLSSTTYYPPTNDLAEDFNKTIGKLQKKFVSQNQCNWDDRLNDCLWAYQTIVRTQKKTTPFFLVYDCEAVLPLEIQIPSLRVTLTTKKMDNEKLKLRLEEHVKLSVKHFNAQQKIKLYRARISAAYNKKVKVRTYEKGDLVMVVRWPMIMTHKTKGKFQ